MNFRYNNLHNDIYSKVKVSSIISEKGYELWQSNLGMITF